MQNKINVYKCTYGHETVTVDLVEGTTPMTIRCRQKADDGKHNCTSVASSLWYNVDQSFKPEYEWYKPESLKGLSPYEKDHVKQGGLLLRKIDQTAFIQWLHQLTALGYEQNVMVSADHKDVIELYFSEGRTPEQALPRYIKFKQRWEALKQEED